MDTKLIIYDNTTEHNYCCRANYHTVPVLTAHT